MIAAGSLKYLLKFKTITETQTESGFITKGEADLFSCRAAKVSTTQKYGENAKELFHSSALEFRVRYNSQINTSLIVVYNNEDYKIISADENKFDNSILLVIEKLNK